MNIVSSSEMKAMDKKAIEGGISSITLMKRASLFMKENIDSSISTCILCGSGNNGGDGLSLAEDLVNTCKKLLVVLVSAPKTDEAKYYLNRIKDKVETVEYTKDLNLTSFDQIIDCMLGVGLDREVTGKYKDIIDYVNSLDKYVVACDIPSGLSGSTGLVSTAICANKTVTFGAYKLGHFINSGKDYIGEIIVSDIGINTDDSLCKIYQKEDFKYAFPILKQDLHK